MINTKMSRRDFLKMTAGFCFGVFANQVQSLINVGSLHFKNSFKEAKYYKAGHHLMG